ncbi:MAG: cupin domain-containing protein [Anaerolineae bacterium]|jgi:uncharacterized RmlC-like cupin family protein
MANILRRPELIPDLEYEKGLEIQFGINDSTCGSRELTMGFTVVPPGVRNPAHFHQNAEAGLFILSGKLKVYLGEEREVTIVGPETFLYVSKGEIHGLENMSQTEPATLVFAYGNVPSKEAAGTTFVEDPWV